MLVRVRSAAIAPVMRAATAICLVMSAMLLAEVVFMAAVSLGVMVLRLRPERRYKWEAIGGDEEVGSGAYPMVLVQIPMYNEREVETFLEYKMNALLFPFSFFFYFFLICGIKKKRCIRCRLERPASCRGRRIG